MRRVCSRGARSSWWWARASKRSCCRRIACVACDEKRAHATDRHTHTNITGRNKNGTLTHQHDGYVYCLYNTSFHGGYDDLCWMCFIINFGVMKFVLIDIGVEINMQFCRRLLLSISASISWINCFRSETPTPDSLLPAIAPSHAITCSIGATRGICEWTRNFCGFVIYFNYKTFPTCKRKLCDVRLRWMVLFVARPSLVLVDNALAE